MTTDTEDTELEATGLDAEAEARVASFIRDLPFLKLEECARYAYEHTYRAWWTVDLDERKEVIEAIKTYFKTGTSPDVGLRSDEFYWHAKERARELTLLPKFKGL